MEDNKDESQSETQQDSDQEDLISDIEKELAECREAKKAIELKYQASLKELASPRVEPIYINSDAEESLNHLRKTIEHEKSIITKLKTEIDKQKKDAELLRDKYSTLVEQDLRHFNDWKKASGRISSLEAENRALRDRVKQMMNQSMNMSSASSLIDNRVPPPPPVDVPSVDEFLRMSADQSYGNIEINSSIPPPPPVEAPLSNLLLQSRSGNRSVNSSYG